MRASESPQSTIPSSLMITPYHPDVAIYNETCNLVALLELTYPLDTFQIMSLRETANNLKRNFFKSYPN